MLTRTFFHHDILQCHVTQRKRCVPLNGNVLEMNEM